MRPAALATVSLLLSGAALTPAAAQTGWVDPPARSATPPAAAPAPKEAATEAKAAQAEAPAPKAQAAAPARQRAERPVRRAERHRPESPRRLAQTPPPAMPAAAPAATPAAEARFTDWAGTAQALTADYLGAVSKPGARMVADAPRFYGERVRFYGREMTLAALMAEKRRFAQRWPERAYTPRGMRTACNGALATCIVRTQVSFHAASPGRGAVSQGLAEVVLEVSLAGPRPVIVSETSRVLRRGGDA